MQLQTHYREMTSLSGIWQVTPDPYVQFGDEGAFGGDQIYDPDRDTGEPADAFIDDGYEVPVPGCWNEELPAFEHYEGAMWYARRVSWDRRTDRAYMRFGAANYRADVWLNGTHLGHHEGGFTPFAFEVTDHLDAREDNLLAVRVDATRTDRKLPAERTDWFTFGGLTREVELVTVPERFVRNVKVKTDQIDGEVEVTVRAWIDDPQPDDDAVRPQVEFPGLDSSWTLDRVDTWERQPHRGTNEVAGGTVYEAAETFSVGGVELWSPDEPRLYDVHVSIDGDELRERVGLRTVTVDGSDVLVNGNQVTLRGVSMHEEADGRGRSLRPADREQRFEWLHDLDCNFARLAHYPHHPEMARRADEEGVLLWEEVPAYWSVAFDEPAVQENYRQQLGELVQRDWNRASVILWSIANETPHGDEARNRVLPEMIDHVRGLDSTRLVTAACFMMETEEGGLVVADPLAEHLDVYGLNEYRGWYRGEADDLERFDDDPSGPPILISEVGASAERGNLGPADELWTEQHQAEFYRDQLAAIDTIEQCCGLSPWALFDFKSPRRQNPHQRGYNRKGLISEDGHEKAAFDVLRRYYRAFE